MGLVFTRVVRIPINNKRTAGAFTAAPIKPGDGGFHVGDQSLEPEFLRVHDVQRVFGLKRGHVYALIAAGLVKSVCLRKPGAKTGVRLVHVESLRLHLYAHIQGGTTAGQSVSDDSIGNGEELSQ